MVDRIFVQNKVDPKINILSDIFGRLKDPFADVSTQHKIKKYFEESQFYNAPNPAGKS